MPLRRGGYLVINQTEALVAVDVNSGRATRERNIEATALKTNMEAAEEAARQLRLRDLAGLIVIDFIDMDEAKNNRAVEKKLKDCLKDDRARVQMGKISPFGLMEISRQRRRTGVLEGTTHVCEHLRRHRPGALGRIQRAGRPARRRARGAEGRRRGDAEGRRAPSASTSSTRSGRTWRACTRLLGLFVTIVRSTTPWRTPTAQIERTSLEASTRARAACTRLGRDPRRLSTTEDD